MSNTMDLQTWQSLCAIAHLLSIFATIIRLYRRFRLQQMWWDDCVVGLSLASSLCYLSTVFMSKGPANPSLTNDDTLFFWLTMISFTVEVWSSRLSLAISIIRLYPNNFPLRRVMKAVIAAITIALLSFVGGKIGLCVKDDLGHPSSRCVLNDCVAILNIVADILADAFLLFMPLPLVWYSQLPRGLRLLLVGAFASSIMSTNASVAYAVLVFRRNKLGSSAILKISLVAHAKAATTLLVSNFHVIFTYIYSLVQSRKVDSLPRPRTTILTTISSDHTAQEQPQWDFSTTGQSTTYSLGTMSTFAAKSRTTLIFVSSSSQSDNESDMTIDTSHLLEAPLIHGEPSLTYISSSPCP
ncbi:hypothetical protein BDN72DRAFT_904202 [Pluteus cervinus]|uniref:Uncharacterized protein n=1 Tax=Pluteus cervinus TaxID=181527 RepID=A0ACD3A6L3_9AGAR|nr:hypothetical protein BDN72DRAFT_904202 [Pluteus cervinus]